MDTQQVRNIKRIGTWLAAGLMMLSVGLMLLGWTVPRKAAFEVGVVGFQLFPIAVLAVLLRIMLPPVLKTGLGRVLVGRARPLILGLGTMSSWLLRHPASLDNAGEAANKTCHPQWVPHRPVAADDPLAVKDPMGSPLKKGYTNTSPIHESVISNPDGYIPDYDAVLDDSD